jgi:hypothetical protein
MPRVTNLVPSQYEHGLALYRSGHTLSHLFNVCNDLSAKHEEPDADHDVIDNSIPSVMLGFADGLIDDIRNLAAARRGSQA